MPSIDKQPSEKEVDAIKQQLKLLGHTLPTEVIVKFLQDNNELLTACQHSRMPSRSSVHGTPSRSTTFGVNRQQNQAGIDPGLPAFNTVAQAQAVPQLDVTWASTGPGIHARPFDGTSGFGRESQNDIVPSANGAAQQIDVVRKDGADQLLCGRDIMSNASQNMARTTYPSSTDSILEKDFHNLKAELEELAAGLNRCEQSEPARLQSRVSKQRMQSGAHASSNTHSAARQDGAYHIDTKHGLTSAKSAVHSFPLQNDLQPSSEPEAYMSTTDADQYVTDRQQQQGTVNHAESDPRTSYAKSQNSWSYGFEGAEDIQTAANDHLQDDWKCDDDERDGFAEHGQGPRRGSRGVSPSPQSVLGCSSSRSLPVLNNSFIVPAQAAKPKKVDRVTRYSELQQIWNKDAFLRSGGLAKTSRRKGEKFNELYAACHAAESKLKDLTLRHGKAVKGVARSRAQQENVAPTEKRRDTLRWETRMRMQLRDDNF